MRIERKQLGSEAEAEADSLIPKSKLLAKRLNEARESWGSGLSTRQTEDRVVRQATIRQEYIWGVKRRKSIVTRTSPHLKHIISWMIRPKLSGLVGNKSFSSREISS